VGLVFDATPALRAGLALSSAARAPAQAELYARGVHEATATWEVGDAGLELERARSLEMSLRWRGGRVHADGALWVSDFRNFIYGALTGRTCSEEGLCVDGDAGELVELLYTSHGARFHGAEGHAEIDLLRHAAGDLHFEVSADLVRARLDDGAGHVPRIPPWRLRAGMSWQGTRVDARLFVRYSGAQRRNGTGESPTSAFTSVDAEFAWRPLARRERLELALTGRNLGDSRQRNAIAFNKDEVMLPGRDVRLTLRALLD
jgi:iron complex outermembrane receptor protein